jgi:DNA-binding MarR family transcriptional regulator
MKPLSRKRHAADAAANGFRLEDFLPYQLSVAANRISRLFARRYSEAFGLSIPEWRVIAVVGRVGTLSPSAVGDATTMDKVKVSRAAASLVARGLVKQAQDPRDGRGRLLSLTRKGIAVHQDVVPLARELEASLSQGFSRTEWAALRKALPRLNAHALDIAGADLDGGID